VQEETVAGIETRKPGAKADSSSVTRRKLSFALLRHIEWIGIGLVAIAVAAIYFSFRHAWKPTSAQDKGFFEWFDQVWYLRAALAFARGDLDPSQHYYFPGFSLLGAPFVKLTPLNPFLIPDFICLIAALWLFVKLCEQLFGDMPLAKLCAAIVFLVASVLNSTMFYQWLLPTSSTGATPLIFAGLLAAMYCVRSPAEPRFAFYAMLATCGIAWFRPTDVLPGLVAIAAGVGLFLLLERADLKKIVRFALAGAAGGAVSLGLLALLHVAIYGFRESHYMTYSSAAGFEWRIIPFRWVTMFLDTRPYLPDGEAVLAHFPYVALGFAGCTAAFATATSRQQVMRHAIVVGMLVLHIAIYCGYRELLPAAIYRFGAIHYFKTSIPLLTMYGVYFLWLVGFTSRRLRAAVAGIAALALLLPWRVELQQVRDGRAPPRGEGNSVVFNADLTDVGNSILLPTLGDWNLGYLDDHLLQMDGRNLGWFQLRLVSQPGGTMLVPIRPIAKGEGRITPKRWTVRNGVEGAYVRWRFVYGIPCVLWNDERPECLPTELLPPVDMSIPATLRFTEGTEVPYLAEGWSFSNPGSRQTDGPRIGLRFHLTNWDGTSPLVLGLEAAPYVPPPTGPLRINVFANQTRIARWELSDPSLNWLAAVIPPEAIGPDRNLRILMHVKNPRSPRIWFNQREWREFGLLTHAISLRPLDKPSKRDGR
jgi:hypothetical protein